MDMGFSCRKNAFFQAPIKLAPPFPAAELQTENFTDMRIFLKHALPKSFCKVFCALCWAARGGRVAWRIFFLFLGRFLRTNAFD